MTELVIKAGYGGRVELHAGQVLDIISIQGLQVCNFFAFNKENLHEHSSPTHTRSVLDRVYLRKGDWIATVLRRRMFEIVEDTYGRHDICAAACDEQFYRSRYGSTRHRSCRSNLADVMAPEGLLVEYLPNPVNFFQDPIILPDGRLIGVRSSAQAGERVTLRALLPVIAVGSACPQDRTGSNGKPVSDIKFVVRSG